MRAAITGDGESVGSLELADEVSASGAMVGQFVRDGDVERASALFERLLAGEGNNAVAGAHLEAPAWVGGLEPGRARDAGVGKVVNRSLGEGDGGAAFACSATMTGAERIEKMERSLKAWSRDDADVTVAMLAAAFVTEAARERLGSPLK